MKKPDYKLWIIYLCIAAVVALILTSCGASKKLVNISKAHVDSTAIEKTQKTFAAVTDSLSKKTQDFQYKKETKDYLQPVEIDAEDSVVFLPSPGGVGGGLVITNKLTGKKKVFLPQKTITEWGNIAKSSETHLQKKTDSTVNQQKSTKLISEKKEVQKQKERSALNIFNFLWLLLLIPVFFGVKRILKHFNPLDKLFNN